MKVQGKQYRTIWYDETRDHVVVIDQRKLPFEFTTLALKNEEDAFFAIREMVVRGAPLIGVTAAFGLYLSIKDLSADQQTDPSPDPSSDPSATDPSASEPASTILHSAYQKLLEARPTAVNLKWALDRVMKATESLTGNLPGGYTRTLKRKVLVEAQRLLEVELESCRLIGEHGVGLIEELYQRKGAPVNILTHCNAGWLACIDYGTATSPIYAAHEKGIPVHVWVDETRPRNQGARLTAWELGQHGIDHSIVADNTGGHLMQEGMVDLVIVGSDRTAANGDVANKIGTYLKALAAKDNHIPFYVALPTSSIDMTMERGVGMIPIEERSPEELTIVEGTSSETGEVLQVKIMPDGSKAVNYGFDVTPAKLVTGFITEKGVWKQIPEHL